jgi:hypothetical protein
VGLDPLGHGDDLAIRHDAVRDDPADQPDQLIHITVGAATRVEPAVEGLPMCIELVLPATPRHGTGCLRQHLRREDLAGSVERIHPIGDDQRVTQGRDALEDLAVLERALKVLEWV